MSRGVMAVFTAPERLERAAHAAREAGFRQLDTFTPFAVPQATQDDDGADAIGWWVAAGGLIGAAVFFGLEWYSAVHAYPFDSGSRPLNSWPVFLFAPFEIGVLVAAIFGFVAFLAATGLPRLHHPAFAIEPLQRASQDRFLLILAPPRTPAEWREMQTVLEGALETREVEL